MSFIQDTAYLIAFLFLLIIISEWLAKFKYLKHIGSSLIIIILGAIFANLHFIPSSSNVPHLYDQIFTYGAPLGIFYLLLEVKLTDLKLAGLPMLLMFLLGAVATVSAALLSYYIIKPQQGITIAPAIAGMFTGTYIGGSANLNAVALAYQVNHQPTLYAAVNAVDNIITTVWILMTIFLPIILQKYFPRKRKIPKEFENKSDEELRALMNESKAEIKIMDISILIVIGFGGLYLANIITSFIPQLPAIITLTTLALILAQIPFIQKLQGGKVMGIILIMLFLAVIGAFCDIDALRKSEAVAGILLRWDFLLIFLHGLILFGIGGLLKVDWDIIGVASNANVGGSTSAPVCAASLGRKDLQLPGLLVGALGNALGTYLGFMVVHFLL